MVTTGRRPAMDRHELVRRAGPLLQRGTGRASGVAASRVPRWLQALLRAPLAGKLAGANAVIVMAATAAALAVHGTAAAADQRVLLILGLALSGSLVVNVTLVVIALRPLGDLEATAARVWQGDLDARVPQSLLADVHLARIGGTLNVLLDGLTSDRARMRRLAAEVISAGDRERAHIARELHDSAAQSLAALVYQLSAMERELGEAQIADPGVAERLASIKEMASAVLEEVRLLAHTVHPRVLDDLGLPAALKKLAREVERSTGVAVSVTAEDEARTVPATLASVLYRVAQESVNNAVRHGAPANVTLTLRLAASEVSLEVEDNGRGFDADAAERRRPGMGLFTMRERVALVNGQFHIASRPGHGTRITAILPLDQRGPA